MPTRKRLQTEVGKQSAKKKSGASARPSEDSLSRVRKKNVREPSKFKKPPNPDHIEGVLSDLKHPPTRIAFTEQRKRFVKHLINPLNPWLIFENENNPDLYVTYGDCVLNLWIYFLKFFIPPESPNPAEAIRILEDEIETLSKAHIFCLTSWNIPSGQAKIIVESRRRAFLNLFALELWGSKNPELDCSNKQEVMRAHLYRSRKSHQSLSYEYETAFMQKQFKKDHKKVYQCLNSILSGKKSEFSKLDSEANHDRTLIFNWILGEPANGIPPMCMWSSQAIIKILKLEGHNLKGFMFDSVKNRVSKKINRLGLVRPTPPVPSYSVKYTNCMFSMHPTKRGDVNSGKQTSGS